MKFTVNDIKQLKKKGKIRGFRGNLPLKQKPLPEQVRKSKGKLPLKSKALAYMEAELEAWANDNYHFLLKEYRFDEKRKYRFDFAFKFPMIAIEYEGGIFLKKSGHNTAIHYTKDANKYNLAVINGWRVLRFTALNYKTVRETLDKLVNNDAR